MNEPATSSFELLLQPKIRDLGEFSVRRVLPDPRHKLVGPFIFFDHMGPVDFSPGSGVSVRPHPHIGIATITYLFAGEITHRDSLGCQQVITRGAVNWMTAGRGIVHSERTPRDLVASGSHLHGIQAWVALPLGDEECEPAFDHYPAAVIPVVVRDGVEVRVVIGKVFGVESPVRTASPTLYAEVDMATGAQFDIPDDYPDRAIYVVEGRVRVGVDELGAGVMGILPESSPARVDALSGSRVMLLGGEPLEGPRKIWWNFVSSRPERIEQAKRDWAAQRFERVPGESDFIPLPES
ncbi:MAG: pirin family protein [Gammaproteobacteria bacterium]|nr:pirin family protein [Gammaproteobacteria bacterium]MDH4255599.1 pirin family protein [Gammaproteobacteria bacterium]MDH5310991.1 pirin family protein [Gammaproteobacteria bacterium]